MTVTLANAMEELAPLLTRLTGEKQHAPIANSTLDVLWVTGAEGEMTIDPRQPHPGMSVGIAARFPGWHVSIVDGRDHVAIEVALKRRRPDRPHVVIAQVERKFR